jgi:signal transduction histidine kinase
LDGGANAKVTLESLQAIAQSIGHEIHQVALELRPTSLDDHGLVQSLTTLLEDWAVRAKVAVEFDHATLGTARLPAHVETTLYRVVSEALRNVVKHARATRVSVILQKQADTVIAIIEDDGAGCAAASLERPKRNRPYGLLSMKERVALHDGELTLESQAGRGTTVIVRLPLRINSNHPGE